MRKVSPIVSLGSPRRTTMVETFCCWQIFCVLGDNSSLLNCRFEIIERYRPVLAKFRFLLFLSRSLDKVPFCVTGHMYVNRNAHSQS